MKDKKISEAEIEVMKVIWDNGGEISSKEITVIMEEKMEWKKTTTLTFLSRLGEKNFISAEKGKRITYYTALVTEKSYLGLETKNFFKKVHRSSLKSFIATLHENNDITDEDLDILEKWIKNR